jgi:hypothetical protein
MMASQGSEGLMTGMQVDESTATATDGGTATTSTKCCFRLCKINAEKLSCAASGCKREVHMMCYQGLLLKKHSLDPLPGGRAVCTKHCYNKAAKEGAGGGEDQEEGGRTERLDGSV